LSHGEHYHHCELAIDNPTIASPLNVRLITGAFDSEGRCGAQEERAAEEEEMEMAHQLAPTNEHREHQVAAVSAAEEEEENLKKETKNPPFGPSWSDFA